MAHQQTFVIVGASLAGAKAAETLRTEGFDGRVVLIGEEPDRPYERPMLSKGYLLGSYERERLFVHGHDFYGEHEIELTTSATATGIDTRRHELIIDGTERLPFDRLLLATGARPRRLDIPGADLEGVLYLRTLDDADAIADRVARGGHAVMVGGGWIGAEIAASARQAGCEVTVLARDSAPPLERAFGPEVARLYLDVHSSHGVRFMLGTEPAAIEGDGRVERVVTEDGRSIQADFVVVGIGAQPRTELADGAGLTVERGICVDEHLRSSDPAIFAAGDVADAMHPFYGRRMHVEHWANAFHQGPVAARSMLGAANAVYDRLPYFYSDQFELEMEYRGHARTWEQVVFRGNPAEREFIAFWLSDGKVAAAMNVNSTGGGRALQALIRGGQPVGARDLADPDVPLEQLAQAGNGSDPARPMPRRQPSNGDGDRSAETAGLAAVRNGHGTVLELHGQPVAVYRDDAGALSAVSAVCTHRGCTVEFNPDDRTWDCPCHGARFEADGMVIAGPAERDLEPVALAPDADARPPATAPGVATAGQPS